MTRQWVSYTSSKFKFLAFVLLLKSLCVYTIMLGSADFFKCRLTLIKFIYLVVYLYLVYVQH